MTKTQKGLALAGLLLGGGFIYLLATRKAKALPPPEVEEPGTPDEAAPEIPVEEPTSPATRKPVIEGHDRFPRYSVAVVSTAKGPETFEKEYDPDLDEVRWINFANPAYGSYRDINRLTVRHWPIRISVGGAPLWQNNLFTDYGVRYFGLASPSTPFRALVV